jgi:hypothetical protein
MVVLIKGWLPMGRAAIITQKAYLSASDGIILLNRERANSE